MRFKRQSSAATKLRTWDITDPSAGPGEIYKSENSPFVVKGNVLQEFRPSNAIRYLRDRSINPFARRFLYQGLCAWTICPIEVLRTKNRNVAPLKSNQFVHDAM